MATRRQMWSGLLRQRCPTCLRGPIYKSGLDMNAQCPECGLVFEREPGYFVGSMYISYALSSVFMIALAGTGYLLFPRVDLAWIMLGAIVLFLPFAVMTTRYSRVIWIYLDRWVWPTEDGPR